MVYKNKLFELIHNQKWEEAAGLLKSDEGKVLAKQTDCYGRLPLHDLLRGEPMLKQKDSYTGLLKSLMGVFPDASQTKSPSGNLTIHVAIAHRFYDGVSVIRKMVEVYPQGPKEKDEFGNLPIHVVCKKSYCSSTPGVVAFLIDKHPEGLKTRNNDGDLPIHLAARIAGVDCIKKLEEAYPNGLKVEDQNGNLPIHIAARREEVSELSYFVQRYPEGLKFKNNNGYLPIHEAASVGSGNAMIELAKHYPESLNELGGNNESDFSRHPIIQYCSASRLPMYRQDVLIKLHKISVATPNDQIQRLSDSSDSTNKNKKRLERLQKELDSVKNENRQLANKFQAADEKRFTIEAEKLKLVADKSSLSDELATTKEEKQILQGDLEILKEVAVEGRKSELAIIASLKSEENEDVVSLDTAKSIANSLKVRLDGLSAKTQPNSKPSFAQVVFSSVLKDPDVSMASLVQIIESLSTELSKLESQYINGNVTPQSTDSPDREGDNRTHALDFSSLLDTPGQATKRARVSLSPQFDFL